MPVHERPGGPVIPTSIEGGDPAGLGITPEIAALTGIDPSLGLPPEVVNLDPNLLAMNQGVMSHEFNAAFRSEINRATDNKQKNDEHAKIIERDINTHLKLNHEVRAVDANRVQQTGERFQHLLNRESKAPERLNPTVRLDPTGMPIEAKAPAVQNLSAGQLTSLRLGGNAAEPSPMTTSRVELPAVSKGGVGGGEGRSAQTPSPTFPSVPPSEGRPVERHARGAVHGMEGSTGEPVPEGKGQNEGAAKFHSANTAQNAAHSFEKESLGSGRQNATLQTTSQSTNSVDQKAPGTLSSQARFSPEASSQPLAQSVTTHASGNPTGEGMAATVPAAPFRGQGPVTSHVREGIVQPEKITLPVTGGTTSGSAGGTTAASRRPQGRHGSGEAIEGAARLWRNPGQTEFEAVDADAGSANGDAASTPEGPVAEKDPFLDDVMAQLEKQKADLATFARAMNANPQYADQAAKNILASNQEMFDQVKAKRAEQQGKQPTSEAARREEAQFEKFVTFIQKRDEALFGAFADAIAKSQEQSAGLFAEKMAILFNRKIPGADILAKRNSRSNFQVYTNNEAKHEVVAARNDLYQQIASGQDPQPRLVDPAREQQVALAATPTTIKRFQHDVAGSEGGDLWKKGNSGKPA